MSTFATSRPISLDLRVNVGVVRITAGTRAETVVELAPTDASKKADRVAAQRTRVEFNEDELVIHAPRKLYGDAGSIQLSIELPAGSRLAGRSAMGDLHCVGELGDCEFKTGYGRIELDRVGHATLGSGYGDITVGRATGEAAIHAASGAVRVGRVDGCLTLRNSNGPSRVDEVTGAVRATSANGDIVIGLAHEGVTAHSANGNIRVGDASRGLLDLKTAAGDVEVGIGKGATAWLDVRTRSRVGSVRNDIGAAETHARSTAGVAVHAVTGSGDVVVHPAA
jgi:hypothetical protein